MDSWTKALRDGALAGNLAGLFSAVALVVAGQKREREPAAPLNAVSHWVWGDPALREDRVTLRHTALGLGVHQACALFWSTLHARTWNGKREARSPGQVAAQAAATAATACFVDYHLTPRRFTPGFEHRLDRSQLAIVYGCFALGLAIGTAVHLRRRRAHGERAGATPP